MAKVSVIIPVFNTEKYLRQCLDSVVNQTLKEIEIICVDDGSTDSSSAILAEYAAKDARVKVITRPKTNAGAARNAGLAIATGEYLGFVDSDDWCELSLFEKAYTKAKAEDADLVFWRYATYDERLRRVISQGARSAVLKSISGKFKCRDLDRQAFTFINLAPWTKLVRQSLIKANRITFQEIERANDVRFGCMALAVANSICEIDYSGYVYRIGTGTSLQCTNRNSPDTVFAAWKSLYEGLTAAGVIDVFKSALLNAATSSFFYTLNTLGTASEFDQFWQSLSRMYKRERPFSEVKSADITSPQTNSYLALLRASANSHEYLVRQGDYQRSLMARFYAEREDAKRANRQLQKNIEGYEMNLKDIVESELPEIALIVIGNDDRSAEAACARMNEQTMAPMEVVPLVSPTAERIREAMQNIHAKYLLVIEASMGFATKYSLEKLVLEAELSDCRESGRLIPPNDYFKTVIRRETVNFDLAWYFARPVAPRELQTEPMTENDKLRLLGYARSLWHLDLLPQCGRLFRLIMEFAAVYTDAESQLFLSAVLHAADYQKTREFLSDKDWNSIRGKLDALHNLAWDELELPETPMRMVKVEATADAPLLTYIVPVYNTAPYLFRAIESLRRQTLRNIEIICVDDGSSDESGGILDRYAEKDARISVIHKKNEGVGVARNLAMARVRGKYLSFVDGDDWLSDVTAETATREAENNALDYCGYDLTAFNHRTRLNVPLYWAIANQATRIPVNRVVSMSDFEHLMINASACLAIYRKSFIDEIGFKFTSLKLGEDFTFTMTLLSRAKRFKLLSRPFYHYRRGQPCSAISNLTAGVASAAADEAQIAMMKALLNLYRSVYLVNCSLKMQNLFKERILADILFYAEKSVAVRKWLSEVGWAGFEFDAMKSEDFGMKGFETRCRKMRQQLQKLEPEAESSKEVSIPNSLQKEVKGIEEQRKNSVKDLYIVTGQLNSRTNEPIDSWTFFKWLQAKGIPSRYVIWKEHYLCQQLEASGDMKDVIVTDGDCWQSYEFVTKCAEVLVRAKAVVQENAALNAQVRVWLKNLPDCAYVFMQHGVFFTCFSPIVGKTLSLFNYVNVASVRERDFILNRVPEGIGLNERNFLIGGLPRWDSLRDLSGELKNEKVVLVMLTWRKSFDQGMNCIERSAYYQRLKNLLSPKNLERFRQIGIKIVLAPHHHLADKVRDLNFDSSVEIVDTNMVSYWIRHAKMLVTDLSSVSIDFLFQEKPVVYWMLDHDDLLLDQSVHDDGGKVHSALGELKSVFNQVFRESEVVRLIEDYAKNDFKLEDEKRVVARSFFATKDRISENLYRAIEQAD